MWRCFIKARYVIIILIATTCWCWSLKRIMWRTEVFLSMSHNWDHLVLTDRKICKRLRKLKSFAMWDKSKSRWYSRLYLTILFFLLVKPPEIGFYSHLCDWEAPFILWAQQMTFLFFCHDATCKKLLYMYGSIGGGNSLCPGGIFCSQKQMIRFLNCYTDILFSVQQILVLRKCDQHYLNY